jgi:HPt (histidine-containing phosphotransfer) domain-containing protein
MPAINLKVIGELRALQGVSVVEIIDLFLQEAAVHLSSLQSSLGARDGRALARSAQTLKGSCGNLGAQAMSRICVDLQGAGQGGKWDRAAELLKSLEAEFGAVRGELESEKGR